MKDTICLKCADKKKCDIKESGVISCRKFQKVIKEKKVDSSDNVSTDPSNQ